MGLRDVSLAIKPAMITGRIGPNASGKATLMRLWMGFDRPTDTRSSGVE
jgi:ABC-type multidrug transport system ATPase subunit